MLDRENGKMIYLTRVAILNIDWKIVLHLLRQTIQAATPAGFYETNAAQIRYRDFRRGLLLWYQHGVEKKLTNQFPILELRLGNGKSVVF